jgi:hypothetical protein
MLLTSGDVGVELDDRSPVGGPQRWKLPASWRGARVESAARCVVEGEELVFDAPAGRVVRFGKA